MNTVNVMLETVSRINRYMVGCKSGNYGIGTEIVVN